MLGRAAYHDPYLLHCPDVAWFGGVPGKEQRSRAELLRAFRPQVQCWPAQDVPLKHITRYVLGLFNGQRGGRAFRSEVHSSEHQTLISILSDVFCSNNKK